jgi:hypothetical protein
MQRGITAACRYAAVMRVRPDGTRLRIRVRFLGSEAIGPGITRSLTVRAGL